MLSQTQPWGTESVARGAASGLPLRAQRGPQHGGGVSSARGGDATHKESSAVRSTGSTGQDAGSLGYRGAAMEFVIVRSGYAVRIRPHPSAIGRGWRWAAAAGAHSAAQCGMQRAAAEVRTVHMRGHAARAAAWRGGGRARLRIAPHQREGACGCTRGSKERKLGWVGATETRCLAEEARLPLLHRRVW